MNGKKTFVCLFLYRDFYGLWDLVLTIMGLIELDEYGQSLVAVTCHNG